MADAAGAEERLAGMPGAELVIQGINDLERGELSEYALLVMVARERLHTLGIATPVGPDLSPPLEHRLYEAVEQAHGADAHSRYNALLRRLMSLLRALEAGR